MIKSLTLMFMMLTACQTHILTTTSTQAKSVLTEVLQKLDMCKSRERLEPMITSERINGYHIYSFTCNNSADTNYNVSLTYFDSEAAAHTQFEVAQDDNPVKCFHGYDRYETASWANTNNSFIVEEKLGWRAKKWVISIYASYDYRYFHYNAIDFSEAVYTSGVEHSLFPTGTCAIASMVPPSPAFTPISSTSKTKRQVETMVNIKISPRLLCSYQGIVLIKVVVPTSAVPNRFWRGTAA